MAAAGESVILVRIETSPDDIHGMHAAKGILTSRGGMTSHAAVVARGMGKACVCGAGELAISYAERAVTAKGGVRLMEGDVITLDGAEGTVMLGAVPTVDPSNPALGRTVDELRADLPAHAKVGGAAVENLDLQASLTAKTPLVIGVVMSLGFLLLLAALRAPLAALAGTLASLLSTGAAFGVSRLIFQEGHGAGLLGFTPQGFLDAWAPVFFFAMIFAISMDYTVFLLASAKEHWERSGGDAREAMVGGMAQSGRVIFAAGAVMVAVFFTFALSGPLPPKEMGVILGVAVLLDALVVRLLLVPVLLRLLGGAAWYVPKPLGRLLPNVRFGHA